MQSQEMEYVSPLRKLVRFFESSRDKWKAKHHEVKKQLKLAQNQIRAVEKSRAKWRQDAEIRHCRGGCPANRIGSVKKRLRLIPARRLNSPPQLPPCPLNSNGPARGSYCLGVTSQSLTLVLQAAVSLRGAAAIFVHLPRLSYDPQGDWPTPGTIQMWLLRLGLDALQQPLEQADDWAWLADHTVQIGKTKCLLIVGVRLSKWRELGGELTHHDLSVIALEPVEHSDGETVHRQLEAAVSRTGVPRMIASDHGSDLKKGIAAFQQQHPQVTSCYDIAHKVALLLKKMLGRGCSLGGVHATVRASQVTAATDVLGSPDSAANQAQGPLHERRRTSRMGASRVATARPPCHPVAGYSGCE